MFRSLSDHPQGARIFLIKVTDFKILKSVTLIKENTSSLRMISMRSKHVGAFLNVLM